ncbi:MAG TPA: glycosyltransferase family 2 protein [Gemmatales bacterium]|nr:glycosyltransferase family 2 protein [Gemmatales bacterium]
MKSLVKRAARWFHYALGGSSPGPKPLAFRLLSWTWRRLRWLYHRLAKRQPPLLLVLDGPPRLEGFAALSGWAVSRLGRVVRVEAWVEGRLLASTAPRENRPDVAERFPGFHLTQPCGFRLAPPPEALADGHHALILRISDNRGQSHDAAFELVVHRYRIPDDDSTPSHLRGTNREYQHWLAAPRPMEVSPGRLPAQPGAAGGKISLLMPVYRPRPDHLREAIDSVRGQTYGDWELCLCDDGTGQAELSRFLQEVTAAEPRIKWARHEANRGIAAATNTAWDAATGDWLAFMDQDDLLAPEALERVARRLSSDQPDVLYTDEDRLDDRGCRVEPFFKPDWSPDLLRSMMYLAHLCVYRRTFIEDVGRCDSQFDGGQDWDLALRATQRTERITHLAEVLYHWRLGGNSAGQAFNQVCHERGRRAVGRSLERTGERGRVIDGFGGCTFHVRYDLPEPRPLVSIVIPTKDQPQRLAACLRSIRQRTAYQPFEIVVVDNGSTTLEARWLLLHCGAEQVLRLPGPFNHSRLNNVAARAARGELLLLLNDDVEVLDPDWLTAMVEQAVRPEVGAVGAWLFYPDGLTQHAGIVTGLGLGAVNLSSAYSRDGLDRGMVRLIRNVSAVTGACLLTRRELFLRLSGLDEIGLPTSFNDVDYCMRLRREGLRLVQTPLARLLHHESASRQLEPASEARYARVLWERWGDLLSPDPFWSPNWNGDPVGQPGLSFNWPARMPTVARQAA